VAQKGYQLAADLSNLKVVGDVDLPMLAFTYAVLNNSVASTTDYQAEAFASPGGGTDQAFEGWTWLRDQLQNVLGETAYTLDITGQVVSHIVDAYRATDTTAAQDLDNVLWKDGPPLSPSEKQPPPGAPPDVVIK
jgi:hypothetical protein